MWRFLVALGGFTTIAGLLAIAFGSVIFVSTVGNALIATGATGFTGGLIVVAAGFILRQLERISDVLEQGAAFARPEPAPRSEGTRSEFGRPERVRPPVPADAAVLAVSEAVVPEAAAPEMPPAPPPVDLPEPKISLPAAAPEAPVPRPRGLSFADRLRPPPAVTPETSEAPAAEVPVAERRGRILARPGEAEPAPAPVPGTLRPRSLLDRMPLARPATERPLPPPAPEPEPAPVEPPPPEAAAPEPQPEPQFDVPPPPPPPPVPERAAPPRPPAPPAARPGPEPVVLKSGIVGGMAYTLYSDGSIQAELPDGVVRFASLQELREHVARAAPPPAQ